MTTFVNSLVGLGLSLCIGLACGAQQRSEAGASPAGARKEIIQVKESGKAGALLDEARKAIMAGDQLYFRAFASGDSMQLTRLYSADCWIMPPKGPTLCGPEAPLELFQAAYHRVGLRSGRLITADVFGDGAGFVTEEGYWESYNAGHQLLDKGSYLALWQKTGGGWKMFRQSFHSDREK
jgi:ketosteroid isomerase-like protein